jgi:hypothetical protein
VAPQPGIQNQQVVELIAADLRARRTPIGSSEHVPQVRWRGARRQRHLLDESSGADHEQPHPTWLAVGGDQDDVPICERRQPLLNADDLLDVANPVAHIGGLFESQLLT